MSYYHILIILLIINDLQMMTLYDVILLNIILSVF